MVFFFLFVLLVFLKNLILPAERRRFLKNKTKKKETTWTTFWLKKRQILDHILTLQHIYIYIYIEFCFPHFYSVFGIFKVRKSFLLVFGVSERVFLQKGGALLLEKANKWKNGKQNSKKNGKSCFWVVVNKQAFAKMAFSAKYDLCLESQKNAFGWNYLFLELVLFYDHTKSPNTTKRHLGKGPQKGFYNNYLWCTKAVFSWKYYF